MAEKNGKNMTPSAATAAVTPVRPGGVQGWRNCCSRVQNVSGPLLVASLCSGVALCAIVARISSLGTRGASGSSGAG